MKSTDHLKMPELISTQLAVELSEAEKKKYEELKKDLILQLPDGEITAANAASLTGKLSQMANGAVYFDDESVLEIHQRKLDALENRQTESLSLWHIGFVTIWSVPKNALM